MFETKRYENSAKFKKEHVNERKRENKIINNNAILKFVVRSHEAKFSIRRP